MMSKLNNKHLIIDYLNQNSYKLASILLHLLFSSRNYKIVIIFLVKCSETPVPTTAVALINGSLWQWFITEIFNQRFNMRDRKEHICPINNPLAVREESLTVDPDSDSSSFYAFLTQSKWATNGSTMTWVYLKEQRIS